MGDMISAWFGETTIVDHLLWGAVVGMSIRLYQYMAARTDVSSSPPIDAPRFGVVSRPAAEVGL